MKYLLIAVLASIAFVLIYSRVRPYLLLIRKIVNSLNAATDRGATTTTGPVRTPSKNKLVRCDSCGTWIPADRAIYLGNGLASFCSAECLTKNSQTKEQKLAG